MAPLSLADVKAEARAAGFELCGIRPPLQPAHFETFESWLTKGMNAGMDWMAGDHSHRLRRDPALLLVNSRSLVSLAVRHPLPDAEQSRTGFGRIAAYACVQDYHTLLPSRIKAFGRKIAAMAGKPARMKAFTDSSPLMERDLAAAGGLGWIGKNTCLISPTLGSFFLLAELLLDIELPYTQPFEGDRCGSCRRCIESCPTGCIGEERMIDARRCISYLTIEHKGLIPADLRPLIGNRLFGCDVCQSVCPWNNKTNRGFASQVFAPPQISGWVDLVEELSLGEEGFAARYERYPLHRAGRENHIRNVIICAGNSHSEDLVPTLVNILSGDPSTLLRSHAAWALGRIDSPKARLSLQMAERSEQDLSVRAEIVAALNNKS